MMEGARMSVIKMIVQAENQEVAMKSIEEIQMATMTKEETRRTMDY
jgi:hypothetical protein